MCLSPSIHVRLRGAVVGGSRQRGRRFIRQRILWNPVLTPTSLRDVKTQKAFNSLAADVAIVAAYGLLLPIPILESPRLGCINLHPSLLPRWRGAAPIQRAIMAGDMQTGVDVMRMDAGLDTGPIAIRQIIPIHPDETAGDLTSRLAVLAATVSVNALQSMEAGLLEFHEQSSVGVCYAHKIKRVRRRLIGRRAQKVFATKFMGCHRHQAPFPKSRPEIAMKALNSFALR